MPRKRSLEPWGDATDDPYVGAKKIWDDRLGSARAQAWRWQLCTATALLLTLVATGGLILQSQQAKVTVYIVEVDTMGLPRVVAQVPQNYIIKQASYEAQVRRFIHDVRAVPTDKRVLQQNWIRAYSILTPRARNLFNGKVRDEGRDKKVGEQEIDLQITRLVPATQDSFDVTWGETILDKQLNKVTTHQYSGLITLVLAPPKTDEEIRANPLGIWIDFFSWQIKES
jgi:type IV secretion system protein VirB5